MANFRPLHDRIAVKAMEQEEKTSGGIIIPDNAKEKPMQGEVVAVGKGNKNEDGTTKPAECGIGCPKAWQPIVDDLCAAIVSYQSSRYISELNPKKKIRIFLFKKVWTPVWAKVFNFISAVLDPYRKYRPKNTAGYWTIPSEVSKVVATTWQYKFIEWLRKYNYGVLTIKNMYTKKDLPEAKIAQIKTKWGGLRFYIDGGDDGVYGMIQFAEYLCSKIK